MQSLVQTLHVKTAQQSNDAVAERQREYDKEAYKARSEKLVADRDFTIDTITTKNVTNGVSLSIKMQRQHVVTTTT